MCGGVRRRSKGGREKEGEGWSLRLQLGRLSPPCGRAASSMEVEPSSALLVQAQSDASGGTAEQAT